MLKIAFRSLFSFGTAVPLFLCNAPFLFLASSPQVNFSLDVFGMAF